MKFANGRLGRTALGLKFPFSGFLLPGCLGAVAVRVIISRISGAAARSDARLFRAKNSVALRGSRPSSVVKFLLYRNERAP